MTTDTKVADLPAKWRAWAKRIRGITAGSDLAADIMEGSAEDLEAALARQEADKTLGQVLRELYESAAKGFHILETCGPDGKYWKVSQFRSMADLHAYDDAWTRAMIAVRDAAPPAAQAVDLSDDFSESKDWRESDYNGRIDWLKAMHASQRAEIVRLQNDVEILRALIDQQASKGGA